MGWYGRWKYNGSQWHDQSAPCPGCAPGQAGAWIFSATGPTCSGPAPTATPTTASAIFQHQLAPSSAVTATRTPTATVTRTATPAPTATSATPTPTAKATSTGGIPVAMVTSTPAISGVYRMGVNMVGNDSAGAGDYMQNLFDNPGFNASTDGHLIVVDGGASSSSFTDRVDSGSADGYWVGATASVRTGASAGDTFTISGYTSGGTYTCSPCPTLAAGDAVTEVLPPRPSQAAFRAM